MTIDVKLFRVRKVPVRPLPDAVYLVLDEKTMRVFAYTSDAVRNLHKNPNAATLNQLGDSEVNYK